MVDHLDRDFTGLGLRGTGGLNSNRSTTRPLRPRRRAGLGAGGVKEFLGVAGGVAFFARLKSVEIGDEDLGFFQFAAHFFGHDVERAVVVARFVGVENAETVANGDARRDDEEGIGEAGRFGVGQLVECVCQATIMAMTTVLPEPVAILNATRFSRGLAVALAVRRSSRIQASRRSESSAK